MAVIYEVTLHARAEIADAYLAWLREHVVAMLGLPGFEGAELHALDAGSADERGWCVRYRLGDRAALDAYLRDHAPRMRAEGIARFGDAFRAERRILVPLEF
jgi:antibiotic biosynthesis monooxygenase (ABM) superfamily enzyme